MNRFVIIEFIISYSFLLSLISSEQIFDICKCLTAGIASMGLSHCKWLFMMYTLSHTYTLSCIACNRVRSFSCQKFTNKYPDLSFRISEKYSTTHTLLSPKISVVKHYLSRTFVAIWFLFWIVIPLYRFVVETEVVPFTYLQSFFANTEVAPITYLQNCFPQILPIGVNATVPDALADALNDAANGFGTPLVPTPGTALPRNAGEPTRLMGTTLRRHLLESENRYVSTQVFDPASMLVSLMKIFHATKKFSGQGINAREAFRSFDDLFRSTLSSWNAITAGTFLPARRRSEYGRVYDTISIILSGVSHSQQRTRGHDQYCF